MAITATDVDQLRLYAEGVMERADHHAGKVKGSALTILGGIVWRADADTIRLREYAGGTGNMLRIKVAGHEYVFRYEHKTGQIEIRDEKQNGPVLHTIDDSTPVADIHAIIAGL